MKPPSQGIGRVAMQLFLFTTLSRLVGFIQQVVIADKFGATAGLDGFIVAQSLPNLFLQLMMIGALAGAFVPLFKHLEVGGDQAAGWEMVNSLLNVLIVTGLLLTVLCYVWIEPISRFLAPGFSGQRLQAAQRMGRELLVTIPVLTVASMLRGVNNMQRVYILPAVGMVVGSLVNVGLTWLLADSMGEEALVVSNVIMVVVIAAIAIWAARSAGYRYQLTFHIERQHLRELLRGIGPLALISVMNTLNFYSDRWFASLLPPGKVSILTYAWRFEPVIVGGVSGAIAAPLLTQLSESAARRNLPEVRRSMIQVLRMISLTVLPVCLTLIVLSREVVDLIYRHGAFTVSDSHEVASVLAIITVALLIWSYAVALNQYWFATRQWGFVGRLSTSAVVANIVLDVFLYRPYGVIGLAIATTGTAIIFNAWQAIRIKRELGLSFPAQSGFAAQLGMALLMSMLTALLAARFVGYLGAGALTSLLVPAGAAVVVYLITCRLFRFRELEAIRQRFSSAFRGRSGAS